MVSYRNMGYLIIIQIILLSAINVYAKDSNISTEDLLEDYKYSKHIIINEDQKEYKSVFLDEEIYRYSKSDKSDIRIVDSEGNFVPYYIKNSTSTTNDEIRRYDTILINRFIKNDDMFYDFKAINTNENTDVLANILNFKIDNKNYVKNIVIYGGYDNVNWEEVGRGNIYDVEGISQKQIAFNKYNKFIFYRIKVPNNLERLNIISLELVGFKSKYLNNEYVGNKEIEFTVTTENKISTVIINNPNRLNISKMKFKAEGNFKREYKVYTLENKKDKYYGVLGQLVNLDFQNTKINMTDISFENIEISDENIMVKIQNKDDKPIDIKSIEINYSVDKLVFKAIENMKYKIYFGNELSKKPSYDINLYKNNIEQQPQEVCVITNVIQDIKDEDIIIKKDYKLITNIVIIIVAIVLLVLIVINLKKDVHKNNK